MKLNVNIKGPRLSLRVGTRRHPQTQAEGERAVCELTCHFSGAHTRVFIRCCYIQGLQTSAFSN